MNKLPQRGFQEEAFVQDAYAVFVGGVPYSMTYTAPKADGGTETFTLPALSRDRNIVEKMLEDVGEGEIREVTILLFEKKPKPEPNRIEIPRLILPRGAK